MADILVNPNFPLPRGLVRKLKDMGNGTFAVASVTGIAAGAWLIASTYNVYPRQLEASGRGRGMASRYPHFIGPGNPKSLKASFSNAYQFFASPYEAVGSVPVTIIEAALERISTSTVVPITFNGGQTGAVIPVGTVDFQCDEIPASAFGLTQFTTGDEYRLKVKASVPASTDLFPTSRFTSERNFDNSAPTRTWGYDPDTQTLTPSTTFGDYKTTAGAVPSFATSARGFTGVLLGYFDNPNVKSMAVIGDSISEGDAARPCYPRVGATTAGVSMILFGISSATSAAFNGANPYHRAYYKYTRMLYDEAGTNDRSLKTDPPTSWAAWKAATGSNAVYKSYLTPRTKTYGRAGVFTSMTASGTTVTAVLTTTPPQVGDPITVGNANPSTYNVTNGLVTSVSGQTITYEAATAPSGPNTALAATNYRDEWRTDDNQTEDFYTGANQIQEYNTWIDQRLAAGDIKAIFPANSVRGNQYWNWKGNRPGLTTDGLHPTALSAGSAWLGGEFATFLAGLPLPMNV